jgi:hypothetical protein
MKRPICNATASVPVIIVAAIVLHIPGLILQVVVFGENRVSQVLAVAGAVFEGSVFLLVLSYCFTATTNHQQVLRRRWAIDATATPPLAARSGQTLLLREAEWTLLARIATTAFVVFWTGMFLLSTIADFTFQIKTGGMSPTIFMVMAGFRGLRDQLKTQMDNYRQLAVFCIGSVGLAVAAGMGVYGFGSAALDRVAPTIQGKWIVHVRRRTILTACASALAVYSAGAWSPVTHGYMSVFRVYFFEWRDNRPRIPTAVHDEKITKSEGPNVIFLMHESLSASYLLNMERGRQSTPFFRSLLNNEDMYLFRHTRSLSGNTMDAATALHTGCLPFTSQGANLAYRRNIGSEFKRQGYQTASFVNSMLPYYKYAYEFMVYNYVVGNMDTLVDPVSNHLPLKHFDSSDDRLFRPHFENWLEREVTGPFYAQFYLYNTHWPYVRNDNSTAQTELDRYFESIATGDEMLQSIFDSLNKTGLLRNTILVGSGDHGEFLIEGETHARVKRLNPHILHVPMYMYVPEHLASSTKARETLRSNTERAISTLDVFPTLQHFLYGGSASQTEAVRLANAAADTRSMFELDNCITGFDLASIRIPEDRVALSWNYVSRPYGKEYRSLKALSTVERGLYIKEGKEFGQLLYDSCTSDPSNDCVEPLSDEDRTYWRNVVNQMINTTTGSAALMKSELMVAFHKELGMED